MKNEIKNFFDAVDFEGPIVNSNNVVFLFITKSGKNAIKSLIKTGLFHGNEEFIRLRISSTYGKMDTNQFTITKCNGDSFSWQSGGGSNSLVSDQMMDMASLIKEAADTKIGMDISNLRKEDFMTRFHN